MTRAPVGISGTIGGPALGGTPAAPSKVGGIYLKGAAEALSHLGSLSGVAIDRQTGRLVLISRDQGDVGLPPLRLDDVATVFRSVYEHGESPWVTIDPNPKDPRGPAMLVRHGEGTARTYVGWVLFEADRLMKVYSLGKDNITQQAFASAIPGYADMLTLAGSEPRGGSDSSSWERFWIKPAAVERRESGVHDLTLLDVPLMVETEPMVLRGGKLETATGRKPSREADAFSRWFTENYDRIAQEARSVPPPETGITVPVPVFAELRRIALISAVAEALRDQGVEFPQWFRDHEVAEVPVSPTTPSTRATYEGERVRRQIYGGATLSPADRDVHVKPNDPAAGALAQVMWRASSKAAPFAEVAFERDGARYKAVVLPGNDTRDLGASHLEEVDVVVPLPKSEELRLVRHYHSFFAHDGTLGKAWTFDFPRLEQQRRPTLRTGSTTRYRIIHALASPLNTYTGTFADPKFVPEVDSELIVPEQPSDALGLRPAREPHAPEATLEVLYRDGRRLLFAEGGNLVAWKRASATVVYRRGARGEVQAIQAWQGNRPAGEIRLRYDERDRLVEASGSSGDVARYAYGPEGTLASVTNASGSTTSYRYSGGLLTGIARDGGAARQFEYDGQGRLVRERNGDGRGTSWSLERGADSITVRRTTADGKITLSQARYDLAMEPLFEEIAGRRVVSYSREADGSRVATVTMAGAGQHVLRRSADGRALSWRSPEGGSYRLEADQAGRVTTLSESGRLAAVWRAGPDGLLESVTYETFAARPEYDDYGDLRALLLTPPQSAATFDRWLSVQYDESGRVGALRDYSGLGMHVTYDRTGEPAEFRSTRGAARFVLDDRGRLQAVTTSWGYQVRNSYDAPGGQLRRTAIEQGGGSAAIEFENGIPTRVRQFDGGEFVIAYEKKGDGRPVVSSIRTPSDLRLTYEYDPQGRPTAVNCGRSYRMEYTFDTRGRLLRMVQAPVVSAGR